MRPWFQLTRMEKYITGGGYYIERDAQNRLFVYEADTASPRHVFVSTADWQQAPIETHIPTTYGWTEVFHSSTDFVDDGLNDPSPGHPNWGNEDSIWLPGMQNALLTEISSDSGYHRVQKYAWAIYEMTPSGSRKKKKCLPFRKDRGLFIHPNPSDDFMLVQLPEDLEPGNELRIFNMTGELVLRKKVGESRVVTIKVASLPEGFYILELEAEQPIRSKIVIH